MIVKTVLSGKDPEVVCTTPEERLPQAIALMADRRIGALVVVDTAGRVIGIISERDIIRGLRESGPAVMEQPVSALMTSRVTTVATDANVDDLMALMTDQRVRHLPVLEGGVLVGIVSIGDVVKHKIAEAEQEARELRAYIAG